MDALQAVEAPDTAAFVVATGWTAALAATGDPDIAAFTGLVPWLGTLAATDGSDSASMRANVISYFTIATTAGADVAAFSAFTPFFAAVEAPDVAAFAVLSSLSGDMAASEAPDIMFTADSFVGLDGAFDVIEDTADTCLVRGHLLGIPEFLYVYHKFNYFGRPVTPGSIISGFRADWMINNGMVGRVPFDELPERSKSILRQMSGDAIED